MTFRTRTQLLHQQKWSGIGNDRGSVLIGVVIVMVIVGAMGGALLTMNNTSSVNQFGSMDGFRAFYLAESGGRYAIPVINKNLEDPATLLGLLDGHTFTFSNGDRFQLALSYVEPVYTLLSTGILAQGTRELNATRQITYRITKLGTQIDFPFDDKNLFKENFEFDGRKGKLKDKKKDLDGTSAVELKGDDTYMHFDWDNPKANLPDLVSIWNTNDQMLSYDMQLKIKIIEEEENKWKKKESPEFLVGLTFRDNGSDMYGLSFLKVDSCSDKHTMPGDFCSWGLSTNTLYVVLWKNIGGAYSLIDSHEIESASILDDNALSDWSTLVVHVEEDYLLDADGNRQDLDGDGYDDRLNRISGSVQGADAYPRGTIDWNFEFQDIPWDPVTDSSLTTETLGAGPDTPSEIGIHNFVNKDNVEKVYIDDFSIRFNSSSGNPSSVEQY